MSFGFGVMDFVAVTAAACKLFSIFHSCARASDHFTALRRETDSLLQVLQEFEQILHPYSQGPLYDTNFLTQTVSDCGTTLKQIEQLLEELKVDDGTTSKRNTQLKRKLYVFQTNIVMLQINIGLHVSKMQEWSLPQSCLLIPEDASTFLQTIVKEPIGVPISDAAGSMDVTRIIYRSDKDLVAMRVPRKECVEGRDDNLSKLHWVQGSTAGEKSTPVRALIDAGVCTNFMTRLGDRELCDRSISTIPMNDPSQDSYCHRGLDKGTVPASSSISETRFSASDLYNSFTKCNSANCYPFLPISSSKDLSYESLADFWSDRNWSDDTPRQWSFLRSSLKRLGRAMSSVSLRTSKVFTLVSPIFFTSSASAVASHCGSQNDPVRFQAEPHDYNSWFQAIDNIQRDLLHLWTHPDSRTSLSNDNNHPNAEVETSTILLACFLCTSSVALVAQAGRNDPYQTHIVGFCAMLSSIGGALRTVNVQEFVFVYLFWGCLAGLAISLILHRVGAVTALEQRGSLFREAGRDHDGLRRGAEDQKS